MHHILDEFPEALRGSEVEYFAGRGGIGAPVGNARRNSSALANRFSSRAYDRRKISSKIFGTDLFKYVPGVNVGVALLIQPPIVAAIAYSVGSAFKSYYRVLVAEGRALSQAELQKLAADALRKRIG